MNKIIKIPFVKQIADQRCTVATLCIVFALFFMPSGCGDRVAVFEENEEDTATELVKDENTGEEEEPQTPSGDEVNDGTFCSLENMNKTIPIVNEFLAGLPDGISKEETFQSLVTWFKSYPCIIDAAILYSFVTVYPPEMGGVSISMMDNGNEMELYLDFAIIDNDFFKEVTYKEIAGYHYGVQNRIHVKTKYTKIDKVFDFINSLELDVEQIQNGCYLSTMTPSTDNLQNIVNGLKAKPYTNNSWVAGNMNGDNNQMIIHLTLYDMKNVDYQADWFKSMNVYQLEEYPFEEDDDIYGPGHTIVFQIPEGTGKEWEAKFKEYEFVRWTEMSHSRCEIR